MPSLWISMIMVGDKQSLALGNAKSSGANSRIYKWM